MNVVDITQVASHWDHLCAPCDLEAGLIKDSLKKRVAGLSFLVLGVLMLRKNRRGMILLGAVVTFYSYKAYVKVSLFPDENDAVIERIKTCSKKVGIVLGRRRDQYLPEEKGWLWISLDTYKPFPRRSGRLHLDMDFNDDDNLQQLAGLFDKIVVDFSTSKFAKNPVWDQISMLLKTHPDAEMITETFRHLHYGGRGGLEGLQNIEYHHNFNRASIGLPRPSIFLSMNEIYEYIREGSEQFLPELEKIFYSVEWLC